MKKVRLFAVALVVLAGVGFLIGRSAGKKRLQNPETQIPQETTSQIKQELYTFKVEGFDENRRVQWKLEGESADVAPDKINIRDLRGMYYGKDATFTVFADSGIYNKENQDIELKDNIVGKTSDGGELVTDYAKWSAKNEEITTDSYVIIKRQNITCMGRGLITKPRLRWVKFRKDVRVDIAPDKTIFCNGPFEVDHEKNLAIFNNHVKIIDTHSETFADKLTVYLNPDTNEIERVITEGNVRVVHTGDVGDMGEMEF